jgi:hypothetical protein
MSHTAGTPPAPEERPPTERPAGRGVDAGEPAPGNRVADPAILAPADDEFDAVNTRAIVLTVAITAIAGVAAHGVLLANYKLDWGLPWEPIVAMALTVTPLVVFAGFFLAARRARIAIAASFILTFLVMLPFALTLPGLGENVDTGLAKSLIDQFTSVVGIVVVFYFGSETVISGIKLWTTAQNPGAATVLARADRDLPATKTTGSSDRPARQGRIAH